MSSGACELFLSSVASSCFCPTSLIKCKAITHAWRIPNLPRVWWMSFISASGLPADVHQQLCNNLMAADAAAEGAWDCGVWWAPFLPPESLQVHFHPVVSFRILMSFYLCENSTGLAEILTSQVIKALVLYVGLVQILWNFIDSSWGILLILAALHWESKANYGLSHSRMFKPDVKTLKKLIVLSCRKKQNWMICSVPLFPAQFVEDSL